MKTNGRAFSLVALVSLALAFSVNRTVAQVVINRFDAAAEVPQWRFDFGSVPHSESFDAGMDANNNPASGSMRVVLNFSSSLSGENKAAYTRDLFPGLNGATFSGMSMDVRIDPGSAPDAFGNNGYFQLVIRNTGNYDYNAQFGDNVRSADGWRHISVSPLTGGVNDIRGITWQLYGGPSQNINGPVTLWFDNVQFTPVPEPSSVALAALSALIGLGLMRRNVTRRW